MEYKNIWLITDTHWNHAKILEYEHRPENYNELIIDNCRKVIKEEDLILHLGDVIFSRQSELYNILEQIPGTKVLIRGNHDKNKEQWYLDKGFSKVYDTFKIGQIIFSHEPIEISKYPGMKYNIHGHFHSMTRSEISRSPDGYPYYSDNHLLLSIEKENYKPRLIQDFLNENAK